MQLRAGDADAVGADDHDRRREPHLGGDDVRMALRPLQELGSLGDVVGAPDQRDLDRVPALPSSLEVAQQVELSSL
jgi:hypothetical protein